MKAVLHYSRAPSPRLAPRSASHKTQVSVLVFANNADGTSSVVLWALFFAISWLTAPPNAQISFTFVIIALFARLEFVDAVCYVRALQASFAADPAGVLARLQQGVPR